MRALMLGSDPTIFETESPARQRMRTYAHAIGELHVVSTAKRGAVGGQEGNLFLYPVHTLKLFKVRALAKRARALILEKGIEVVSAQDPFEHGLAAQKATEGTLAKLHIQVHTDFLSPWFVKGGGIRMNMLNRSRCRIADRVLPKARGIRAVSERVKASLVARYGERIPEPSVIPVSTHVTPVTPALLPKHQFKFALVAVGRLEAEKRVQDIIQAIKIANQKYSVAGVCIIGDGRKREELQDLVHSLKCENHVLFLGERSDARALMASASAFIQASAYEGYGRTLIEAACAKVPIITTDVGIVGEVFRGNEEAIVVPVADPVALAKGIIRLIDDNDLRQKLVINADVAVRAHLATIGALPARIADDLARTLHKS